MMQYTSTSSMMHTKVYTPVLIDVGKDGVVGSISIGSTISNGFFCNVLQAGAVGGN